MRGFRRLGRFQSGMAENTKMFLVIMNGRCGFSCPGLLANGKGRLKETDGKVQISLGDDRASEGPRA